MRWRLLANSALVWTVGMACGAQAAAQTVEDEVIVVTAQKREESLQAVPISVRALSGETLDRVQADGLEDISTLVPSLSMASQNRGGSQVQIRGLGSNVGNVGTVAIYNDGVISASRTQSTGTFAERDAGLYDIERVEVLRGPQGTLYGEGSFGGVINIISRRPDASEIQASFSGSVYDVEEGSSDNHDLSGMFNLPLVEDKLALRVVAYDYQHDGYIDVVDIGPPVAALFGLPGGAAELVEEDANTEEVSGGRIMLRATPNANFDATLIYKAEDIELGANSMVSPYQIAAYAPGFDPNYTQAILGPAIGGSTAFGSEAESRETILQLDIATPIGNLTSVSGYGTFDSESANSAVFNSEGWSEEVRLASDSPGAFNWIAGAYYREASRNVDYLGFDFLEESVESWAVFGQTYWEFVPNVTATVGLRYEEQSNEMIDQFYTAETFSGDFESVLPKFAIAWAPDEDMLLYASAARGFRAGGTNSDQSLGTDANFVESFDPDTIWNYEIGSKMTFWEGRATINTALFYIDWSDIQIDRAITSLINPPTQFVVVNGEEAHSYGIEADIFLRPTDNWQIALGGSWLNAEYDSGTIDSATLGPGIPLDGQVLPSTPEYLLNASVERSFPLSIGEAYLRADGSIRGSSYGDVPNEVPGGDLTSGQLSFMNVRAGFRQDNWELQVFVTNVFNTDGGTYSYYDGSFTDRSALVRPRTIGGNLKLNYN